MASSRGEVVAALGVGAIGGSTAGALLRAGHELTLIDPWYANVERIRRHGLTVHEGDDHYTVSAPVLYLDELERLDPRPTIVLLACKSYDTEMLTRAIAPYMAADGCIVSLQNSLNEDRIASVIGRERTVGCVVHLTASMLEPGIAVRYAPRALRSYTIGELDGIRTERIDRIAAMLSDAGGVVVSDDIFAALWGKLTLSCLMAAPTGITGETIRTLWMSDEAVSVMIPLAGEVVRVSRALGRTMEPVQLAASRGELDPDLIEAAYAGVGEARDRVRRIFFAEGVARAGKLDSVSSLLQDVIRGKRTEIDHYNGLVVREGRRIGVPTPCNERVVDVFKRFLAGELASDPRNIGLLAATPAA